MNLTGNVAQARTFLVSQHLKPLSKHHVHVRATTPSRPSRSRTGSVTCRASNVANEGDQDDEDEGKRFREMSLDYHRVQSGFILGGATTAGKLSVVPTRRLSNQQELSLAYSPGVAHCCTDIAEDPDKVNEYTARGNLVAVISNGTAVLGLGAIGPLASKPVMEGKAVLFKKFAGIDAIDLEVDERDPSKLADIVCALEPTVGAVNLEDIKAPECFQVEEECRARMNIPVFHDDQHGTAIVVAAAVKNALVVVEKRVEDIKVVCNGAGAAAIACLNLLVTMGARRENILVCDSSGVVHSEREGLTAQKAAFATSGPARTLEEAFEGADVCLGLSVAGAFTPAMLERMAERPVVMALSNPIPEIMPDLAMETRPDAVIATGRSDFPNQVNNVLCFPFLFRGALDCGATDITDAMKVATVEAIAKLARRASTCDSVSAAYGGATSATDFGPLYLIPKPFDPRLLSEIAPAVAQAAATSGVASRPIADMARYKQQLTSFVYRTNLFMGQMFEKTKESVQRVVLAEGEDARVLQAVRVAVDEGICAPILIGRREKIELLNRQLGLKLPLRFHDSIDEEDQDGAQSFVEVMDIRNDPRYKRYHKEYFSIMARKGISPDTAKYHINTNPTVLAAVMVRLGDADAMLSGTIPRYSYHREMQRVASIVGMQPGVKFPAGMGLLVMPNRGAHFFADTQVTQEPDAEQLASITLMASEAVRRFGLTPRAALLSHSNFGSGPSPKQETIARAARLVRELAPDLEVDGEMQALTALNKAVRDSRMPDSALVGNANLFVMPNLDAASISYQLVKGLSNGMEVGPITLGLSRSAHLVHSAISTRGLVNMLAVAAVEAQHLQAAGGTPRQDDPCTTASSASLDDPGAPLFSTAGSWDDSVVSALNN